MHRSGVCRLVLRRLRNLRQRRTCCFQLTTYKAIQMPTIHFLKKLFGKEFILFTLLCHTPDDLCSSTMPRAEFHNVKTPFFRNSAKLFLHPHFRKIFQICLFFSYFSLYLSISSQNRATTRFAGCKKTQNTLQNIANFLQAITLFCAPKSRSAYALRLRGTFDTVWQAAGH